MTADAATSLHLVEGIVALGACVSSLELLHIRTALRDDGLLSWRVHRLSHPVIALFVQRIAVDHLLHYPGVLLLIVFRLILAVGLAALAITNHSTVLPLIALVVVTLLM